MAAAAFIGLIAAFIGRAVLGKGQQAVIGDGAGILSVATLLFAILFYAGFCRSSAQSSP